jgi:hypothetical protein
MSQVTDTCMGARYEKVTDISMGAMPGHGHFHGSQVRAGFTANSIGARYEPGRGHFHGSQVRAKYESGHRHFHGSQV